MELTDARLRPLVRRLRTGSSWAPASAEYLAFIDATPGYDVAFFNLTVDFELAWGGERNASGSILEAERLRRARLARSNLRPLLDLCDRFEIPVTIASVGHLALDGCTHGEPPDMRPPWLAGDLYDLAAAHRNPSARLEYGGADLLQDVLDRSTAHELASHTFMHIDLADHETSPELVRFELEESFAALKRLYPHLTTLVFPENRAAHLDLVAEAGYTIYRGDVNTRLGRDAQGLSRFPLGLWLSPVMLTSTQAIALVTETIRRRHLLNFYFHLYEHRTARALQRHLEPLLAFVARERERGSLVVATMQRIVETLENGHAAAAG